MWPASLLRGLRRTPAGATLLVVVGACRVDCAVVRGQGQWQPDSLAGADIALADGAALPLAALAGALHALPALPAGTAMRVLVSDRWLGAVTMPWNPAAQDRDALMLAARGKLAAAGFDTGSGDTIKVAEARFGAPRLTIDYPAALVNALAQGAARLDARLVSVLPLSVAGWALARRHGALAALALVEDGLLALVRGGSCPDELTVRAGVAGSGAGHAGLLAFWQRLSLRDPQLGRLAHVGLLDVRAGQGAPAPLPFVALAVPPAPGALSVPPGLRLAALLQHLRDPLDAVAGAPPVSMSRLALVAGAALLAAGAAAQAVRTSQEVHAWEEAAARAVPRTRQAPRVLPWSAQELARVQAVNVAVRELNLPFGAILRTLAPPPELRVAVLSVNTAPSRSSTQASSVKIVAEARTGAEMARYVAFLAERKPFTGAYLVEHEIDETAPERPYRFTLEAAWSD